MSSNNGHIDTQSAGNASGSLAASGSGNASASSSNTPSQSTTTLLNIKEETPVESENVQGKEEVSFSSVLASGLPMCKSPVMRNGPLKVMSLKSVVEEKKLVSDEEISRYKRRRFESASEENLASATSISNSADRPKRQREDHEASVLDELIFSKRQKEESSSDTDKKESEENKVEEKKPEEPEETSFKVHLDTMMGTSFSMDVYPSETLEDLRYDVSDTTGIMCELIVLLHNNADLFQTLPLSTPLSETDIREGTRLKLLVKLQGGPVDFNVTKMSGATSSTDFDELLKQFGVDDDSNLPETIMIKLDNDRVMIINLQSVNEKSPDQDEQALDALVQEELDKIIEEQEKEISNLIKENTKSSNEETEKAALTESEVKAADVVPLKPQEIVPVEPEQDKSEISLDFVEGIQKVKLDDAEPKKASSSHCNKCAKKLRFATTFGCKCGGYFCSQCRYSTVHACTFDYHQDAKVKLVKNNPAILPEKLR